MQLVLVVLHVNHDFINCHLCQLSVSLVEIHGSDIPSAKIERTLDFPNGFGQTPYDILPTSRPPELQSHL